MAGVANTVTSLGALLKTEYAGGSEQKKNLSKALKKNKKPKYTKLKAMLK